MPIALSPLVAPPIRTPASRVVARQVREVQDAGNQDVCSPAAARGRVHALNQDYREIRTPATMRRTVLTQQMPLQRAVLLSTGMVPYILATPGSPIYYALLYISISTPGSTV